MATETNEKSESTAASDVRRESDMDADVQAAMEALGVEQTDSTKLEKPAEDAAEAVADAESTVEEAAEETPIASNAESEPSTADESIAEQAVNAVQTVTEESDGEAAEGADSTIAATTETAALGNSAASAESGVATESKTSEARPENEQAVSQQTADSETAQLADEETVESAESEPSESEASAEFESETESGSETDAETAAEAETDGEAKKPGLVGRLIGGAMNNKASVGAAAGCLLLGAVGGFFSAPRPAPEVVDETPPPPTYIATTARRTEPIDPLVPFELDPGTVLLGEKLFHDPGLSSNGKISCASCHDIHNGGDDGLAVPEGFGGQPGQMNTPSVLTAAINHAQFWDGRAATLEEQVDGPLTSPTEMNSDWRRVLKYLTAHPRYNEMFVEFLGGEPTEDRVRTALASYQRALLTVDNPFDNWLRGDESALSSDAYAGYFVFKKMNCVSCHSGEGVGGQLFQKLGTAKEYYGDHRPADEQDQGRFSVTQDESDRFVFRVPSLRNVEHTAPYLHDGSVASLEETVALMIEYQVGQEVNQEDVRRLTLFLKSLSGKVPDMPKMPPKPTEEE